VYICGAYLWRKSSEAKNIGFKTRLASGMRCMRNKENRKNKNKGQKEGGNAVPAGEIPRGKNTPHVWNSR